MIRIGFVLKDLSAYNAHVKPFFDHSASTSFVVFHLNKYYRSFIPDKISANVELIDLSNKYAIHKILIESKLDYMVFFNPGNIFDQAIMLLCKKNHIKTIYFQHGVSPDYSKIGYNRNSKIIVANYIEILIKYSYFYSLLFIVVINERRIGLFRFFVNRTFSLLQKDRNSIIRNYGTFEVHAEQSFVYNLSDKYTLMNFLGIHESQIEVVGYPFLGHTDTRQVCEGKYVLYLSSALRAAKVVDIGPDEELMFYQNLAEVISMTDYKLVIKLHPLDESERIKNHLDKFKNVQVFTNYNLADLVRHATFVLGDLSSSLFYAVKYYKPIIILKYSYLKEYAFDLTDWDIGVKADLASVSKILTSNKNAHLKKISYDLFLKNFLNFDGKSSYDIFFNRLKTL